MQLLLWVPHLLVQWAPEQVEGSNCLARVEQVAAASLCLTCKAGLVQDCLHQAAVGSQVDAQSRTLARSTLRERKRDTTWGIGR